MKSIIGAFIMALFIVSLTVPSMVRAGAMEAGANGTFQFSTEDGAIKFVEFRAIALKEGQAEGEMTFSDPSAVSVEDPDDPEKPRSEGVIYKARFDCMQITENKAVIGGVISDSNLPSAVGLRMLLVVEDNEANRDADKLTWGVFQLPPTGWTPTDAERDDDKGAELRWIATDAERKDDVGIPMPPNKLVACQSFPLTSFEFPEIKVAGGDLKVVK